MSPLVHSHGYERIHKHALRSLAELITAYLTSPVEIKRDAEQLGELEGFTTQPMEEAEQTLMPESKLPVGSKG